MIKLNRRNEKKCQETSRKISFVECDFGVNPVKYGFMDK